MSAACVELVEFGLIALVCSSYAFKAQARVVFWCCLYSLDPLNWRGGTAAHWM